MFREVQLVNNKKNGFHDWYLAYIYIYIYIYIYKYIYIHGVHLGAYRKSKIAFPRQLVTETVSVGADGSRRHEGYRINEGGGISSDDCKANFISARKYQANELSGQIAHVYKVM